MPPLPGATFLQVGGWGFGGFGMPFFPGFGVYPVFGFGLSTIFSLMVRCMAGGSHWGAVG